MAGMDAPKTDAAIDFKSPLEELAKWFSLFTGKGIEDMSLESSIISTSLFDYLYLS